MAYYERNGFVLARTLVAIGSVNDDRSTISVKDVIRVIQRSFDNNRSSGSLGPGSEEIRMIYESIKCLIRNLLRMADNAEVERDTFMEFSAACTQFTRSGSFKSLPLRHPYRSLMLELEQRIRSWRGTLRDSDIIQIRLSPEWYDRLGSVQREMAGIRDIAFGAISFG